MGDSLINLLQSRTVLVRTANSIGTGTLIAPGKVLTCAHVVREAVEAESPIEILLPNRIKPGQFIWAEIVHKVYLSDIYEEQPQVNDVQETITTVPLTTEYPDVAVLEINKKDHAIIRLPTPDVDSDQLRDQQFLAFGFQKQDRDLKRNVPQAVSLNYNGEQIVDGIIRKLLFSNGLIRKGMSGAALMERESGNIVGIVHATLSLNDDLGAIVIPLENIWKVFQSWEEDGVNQLYSELQSKQLRARINKQYHREYPRFPMFKKYGIRLLILPVLLFLALWWMFYHLGPIEESGLVAILLVAVSLSGKLLGDWLGKEVRAESGKLKSSIGKVLFGNLFLSGLTIVIALLWTFTSSVWVHGNSEHGEVPITLYKKSDQKEGYQKNLDPTGKTKFLVFASPLKDSMALVPKGREPKTVLVTSFAKNELYYPRDFLQEPIVLIRFDPRFKGIMKNYRVHVEIERSGAEEVGRKLQYIDSNLIDYGAIAIGKREMNISKDLEVEWKQFFEGEPVSMSSLEEWVLHWKNKKPNRDIDLDIGDRIKVTVIRKSNDSILNEQTYAIRDDLTDKLLKFEFKEQNP